MLLAFVAGWILGSFSLYVFLAMTAVEQPAGLDCLDCHVESCGGCSILNGTVGQGYDLAA